MTIFDIINDNLAGLSVPYWFAMADLTTDTPPLFIVYDLYDNAVQSGDGEETATRYTVTIHIISTDAENADSLYKRLLAAFRRAGFVRAGGSYSCTDNFPEYYQRSVDFYYIMEN